MSAIPSMALNEMHRAEKRYEVGRVFGKQEAKQRQLRSILNKLTPQNFEPLFEQVLHVTLFDAAAVPDFVLQIVGRAIGEPIYCKMYAELCYLVNGKLPVYFSSDNKMVTVKRLVLIECQEIFERGFMVVEEGTIKSCEDERKDDKIKTHIHMLGTIQFIGELFKKKMILLKVMHHIIQVLLEGYQNPDEKNIEALCLLMTTAGEMLDDQSEGLMDTYFSRMLELSANQKVSSRVRFMVMNAIDLRNNDWRERRKIERPTKICDVHLAGKQHTQYRPYGFTVISQTQLDYGSPDPCVQDVFEEGLLIRRYEHIGRTLFRSIPNNLRSSHAKILNPDNPAGDPAVHLLETGSIQASVSSETRQKVRGKITDPPSENPVSVALSGPKDKPAIEPARAKITSSKKKKRREILHKAHLPGSSDLYNAYKGPEEKLETARTLESTNSSLSVDMQDASLNDLNQEAVVNEDDGPGKSEVNDWEDAADISTPKLRTSEISNHVDGARKQRDKYGNKISGKKYSRDFLLTFSEQCTQLPVGIEIGSDIVNAVMSGPVASCYVVDQNPSPGRSMDRSSGRPRADRRAVGIVYDDRWAKSPGPFGAGQDVRLDIGHGAAIMNLRPGQGITHGVLRNPRGQPSGQYVGGILTGPLQPMLLPGGVRNGADVDRWQRASNFQRAVPQAPTQVMHKAAKKSVVGIVSDEEEAKQRQLKGILNKLTPQNFEKLFAQVKEVNIDNTVTLRGIIAQIFDKALTEPTFCEMYASFCSCLAADLPDFTEDNEKVTFKRLFLNKCQEEFERGEREQAEADKAAEEGEIEQSEGEREEKRIKARRRMLGNIRLIGELYKKKMLTERIMHKCIEKLLGQYQNPDEEDIEALCKLMSTIGEMIDHPKAKKHIDAYFDMMLQLSTNQKLSSRLRFMLKDAVDLRKNKWQQRRKVEGPKKLEDADTIYRNGLNVIDLCSSDEKDVDLDAHFSHSACLDAKIQRKERMVEEDCYILEPDACQSLTTDLERKVALTDNDSEEDVCIISEKGQVACRDYPHPRHLCAQYPFNSMNHENSCPQCYCYVCDERAPCKHWEGRLGHCHATDKEHKWIDLRAFFKLLRKI